MLKKVFSVFLSLAFVFFSVPLTSGIPSQRVANAAETSGFCGVSSVNEGKNVTWKLTKDGAESVTGDTLTISGTGAMKNFDTRGMRPWHEYVDQITKVVIEDGVSKLGDNAFNGCGFTSIVLPKTVRPIGAYTFARCASLTEITLPNSVTSIAKNAFFNCTGLTSITIPESVNTIGENAFQNCSKLSKITVSCGATVDSLTKLFEKDTMGNFLDTGITVISDTEFLNDIGYEGTFVSHVYVDEIIAATDTKLGGTKHTCSGCGDWYYDTFTLTAARTQTLMPDGNSIHKAYSSAQFTPLFAHEVVDIGDGQSISVYLHDPLESLVKRNTTSSDYDSYYGSYYGSNLSTPATLGLMVSYVDENSPEYQQLLSQCDGDHLPEHIKFFQVNPTVDGAKKEGQLDAPVYMMYEIPEGWDETELEMIRVVGKDDQEFNEMVVEEDGKHYLAVWKDHFSPYAMIDKLTDRDTAVVTPTTNNTPNNTPTQNGTNVKTGDNSTAIVFIATSAMMIAGLYLAVCLKKKKEKN